jgi:hypothetical protein
MSPTATVPGVSNQSNDSNKFVFKSNPFKKDFPKLKNIEIKYGFEGFDERNNFPYRF